jgi:regulatory protein
MLSSTKKKNDTEGVILSEAKDLMDEAELKKAKVYALKATNLRPRSVEELKDKLKQKGFSDAIIAQVVGDFTKTGLINDAKFSKLWVSSRMASNPKGEVVLRRELKDKGVAEDAIEAAINEARKDKSEEEIVSQLAQARISQLTGLDKKTARRRLFGYLKRRGFSFNAIMKVVNEI